jgi:hypothetical protein
MEATGHESYEEEGRFHEKTQSQQNRSRLPDLEHAKDAVLNSPNAADAKRGYRHPVEESSDPHYHRHEGIDLCIRAILCPADAFPCAGRG